MSFFDLKIRVVDPGLHNRNMFNHVLAQIGQPDVLLQKDARQFFDRDKSLPCDLVFLSADLGYGLSAPDIIRYLTRANLVPTWCKFVIVSSDPEYHLSAPVFRYLQTEILLLPVSFKQMRYLIFRTITSIRTFKPILSRLHKLAPNDLVKMVTDIDTKYKDPILDDELLVMKLQLLMKARKPELALKLAAKIKNETCRFRELTYINMITGQDEAVSQLVAEAELNSRFLFGRVYVQTYLYVSEGEYREALKYFQHLPFRKLKGNDSEAFALLLQQVEGLRKALSFVNDKIDRASRTSMEFNHLVATKTKLLFIALFTGELDELAEIDIYIEIQSLAEHRIWQKGEHKFSAYAPFLELGIALHEGKRVAEEQFDILHTRFKKMDVSQLIIMLFAANKLGRDSASLEVHEQLEYILAKVEVSPELISSIIFQDMVLRSSMNKERLKYRLEFLGLGHWQSDRHYRALSRFKELVSKFDQTPATVQLLRRLIRETGLKSYWKYTPLP